MKFFQGDRCNATLGGGRSIQLSYGDKYEISLILRGFLRSSQGSGLYSEAISIRRMAFLLMDFRPLKAVFEKLFLFPMLEKRSNHEATRTEVQIFKNQMAHDCLLLRRHDVPSARGCGGKAIYESGILKIQTTYIIYNI